MTTKIGYLVSPTLTSVGFRVMATAPPRDSRPLRVQRVERR